MSPRVEDSGLYECQVSYHDDVEKKLKLPFTLTVLGRAGQTQVFTNKRKIPETNGRNGKKLIIFKNLSTNPFNDNF